MRVVLLSMGLPRETLFQAPFPHSDHRVWVGDALSCSASGLSDKVFFLFPTADASTQRSNIPSLKKDAACAIRRLSSQCRGRSGQPEPWRMAVCRVLGSLYIVSYLG